MVGAMVFIGRPDYYLDVADDPMFLPAFGGILGLLLIGIFIMYRMVNFRV